VTVTVTDGNGYSVSASAVISVIAGPTVLSGFGALVIVGGVVAVAVIVVAVVALRRRSTPPPPEE